MKGRITARLGFWTAAAILTMSAGFLAATQASAAGPVVLSMDSVTINEDGQVALDVEASGLPAPGLGAWTIGVVYDPAVVSVVSCSGGVPASECNPSYASNRVQLAGATATGLTGDAVLASITFACEAPGKTALDFIVTHFADATEGGPQPLSFKLQSGTIGCAAAEPPLLGDVDCNGLVNSRDALLVLQFEAALIDALPCQELGDVNDDGRIDSVDAGLIKQIDAGLLTL